MRILADTPTPAVRAFNERMAAAHSLAAAAYLALHHDPGNAILAAEVDYALAAIDRLKASLRTPGVGR